ncbi:hypothetical protein DMB66_47190 [Actinoplanes sp. ATCC 53533]|uniref:hypothetical protein n=1 Tax=Actinoplanes sp. ATCC 53533 TaxID=1288362 RepID=UPI000F7A1115|nr:hypothetical protein [Actinoplanes sp. ATCC 53533]RSM47984.1 hypothetical protein DMB66_47190 [Actinoplanes sp. ATCC 53533]
MSGDQIVRDCAVRVRLGATVFRPAGRRQRWRIEAGPWRADGASEKAATDALADGLQKFLTHYRTPTVLSFRGFTAVLSLDLADGDQTMVWTERVVDPGGLVSYSGVGADSWEQVEARARCNLAQRSTDWFDDSSVHEAAAYLTVSPGPDDWSGPDALYRYAAWQRAAQAAMAAGRDNWHEWATEHWAQFAVARAVPAEPTGSDT